MSRVRAVAASLDRAVAGMEAAVIAVLVTLLTAITFAQVAARFLQYVRDRKTLPAWERPNMIAKYAITTQGMALARQRPVEPAPRLAPK